jgi:hypothetical protein
MTMQTLSFLQNPGFNRRSDKAKSGESGRSDGIILPFAPGQLKVRMLLRHTSSMSGASSGKKLNFPRTSAAPARSFSEQTDNEVDSEMLARMCVF